MYDQNLLFGINSASSSMHVEVIERLEKLAPGIMVFTTESREGNMNILKENIPSDKKDDHEGILSTNKWWISIPLWAKDKSESLPDGGCFLPLSFNLIGMFWHCIVSELWNLVSEGQCAICCTNINLLCLYVRLIVRLFKLTILVRGWVLIFGIVWKLKARVGESGFFGMLGAAWKLWRRTYIIYMRWLWKVTFFSISLLYIFVRTLIVGRVFGSLCYNGWRFEFYYVFGREATNRIYKRLDCVLVSMSNRSRWSKASFHHFPHLISNHNPLLLALDDGGTN